MQLKVPVQQQLGTPARLASITRRQRCRQLAASTWGAPEPFMQAPSLSTIADVQRQIEQDLDSAFLSPFNSMRRFEQQMDQQFREFDRQFDRAFADMDRSVITQSC